MHYYRYTDDDPNDDSTSPPRFDDQKKDEGRTVRRQPILSLVLEPRSLVITTSKYYARCLHGISEIEEDAFEAADDSSASRVVITIANAEQIKDEAARKAVKEGGTLKRDRRFSLTCRDVPKVANGIPGLLRK